MTDNMTTNAEKLNSHGLMQRALEIQSRDKKKEREMSNISEQTSSETTSAIIVRDGIFTISENLETSGVKQDPELKSLIDSILR